ncbi:3711_t:CDS:10 [Entrophospora sp. SA101]|nr:3711_t:CDS:10 [Entrophospora sp. SA101]
MDTNNYYGGSWNSLNFRELLELINSLQGKRALTIDFIKARRQAYSSIEYEIYSKQQDEIIHHVSKTLSSFEQVETLASLLKESRLYYLDLAPKLVPCRGELVELLITSGVGRYIEFKALDKTYIYSEKEDNFDKVPCSKEDVFTSQTIPLIDKRKLMRYENKINKIGYREKTFISFLHEKFQIQDKLLSAILYSIALIRTEADVVNTLEGLEMTHRYLKSIGRYGNAAFLVALYGVGSEIVQGFCRVCAVYGGIYMLDHPVKHILIDENTKKFNSLIDVNDQQLSSTLLITSIDYIPINIIEEVKDKWEVTSRAIVIIDGYLHQDFGANMTIFPPNSVNNNKYSITVLHQSFLTQTCPENKCVLHLSTKANKNSAKEDLFCALEKLINITNSVNRDDDNSNKPSPLFTLFYQHKTATIKAKQIFHKICPNEEFLPHGPDPDEEEFII